MVDRDQGSPPARYRVVGEAHRNTNGTIMLEGGREVAFYVDSTGLLRQWREGEGEGDPAVDAVVAEAFPTGAGWAITPWDPAAAPSAVEIVAGDPPLPPGAPPGPSVGPLVAEEMARLREALAVAVAEAARLRAQLDGEQARTDAAVDRATAALRDEIAARDLALAALAAQVPPPPEPGPIVPEVFPRIDPELPEGRPGLPTVVDGKIVPGKGGKRKKPGLAEIAEAAEEGGLAIDRDALDDIPVTG